MNGGFKSNLILIGIVALIGLIVYHFPDLSGSAIMQYDLSLEDVMKLLTNLFFIALLMERFMEVFITVIRQEGKVPLELQCQSAKKSLAALDTTSSDPLVKTSILEAKSMFDTHMLALETYRAHTGRITILASFTFGIIISLAGVHVLQALYDIDDLVDLQKFVFIAVDIILTAGIISGGSKGINSMTKVMGDFFDTRRTLLHNATQGTNP